MAEENNGIVVSFNGVKVKEFRAYLMAVDQGFFTLQDQFLARVVKSWPYDLDPSDPKSYSELDLKQYFAVQSVFKKEQMRLMRDNKL